MVGFFFKSDGGIFIFQNFYPSQRESQEGKCCFSECQNNITKQKIDDIFAEQVTVTYRHFRYKRVYLPLQEVAYTPFHIKVTIYLNYVAELKSLYLVFN